MTVERNGDESASGVSWSWEFGSAAKQSNLSKFYDRPRAANFSPARDVISLFDRSRKVEEAASSTHYHTFGARPGPETYILANSAILATSKKESHVSAPSDSGSCLAWRPLLFGVCIVCILRWRIRFTRFALLCTAVPKLRLDINTQPLDGFDERSPLQCHHLLLGSAVSALGRLSIQILCVDYWFSCISIFKFHAVPDPETSSALILTTLVLYLWKHANKSRTTSTTGYKGRWVRWIFLHYTTFFSSPEPE